MIVLALAARQHLCRLVASFFSQWVVGQSLVFEDSVIVERKTNQSEYKQASYQYAILHPGRGSPSFCLCVRFPDGDAMFFFWAIPRVTIFFYTDYETPL